MITNVVPLGETLQQTAATTLFNGPFFTMLLIGVLLLTPYYLIWHRKDMLNIASQRPQNQPIGNVSHVSISMVFVLGMAALVGANEVRNDRDDVAVTQKETVQQHLQDNLTVHDIGVMTVGEQTYLASWQTEDQLPASAAFEYNETYDVMVPVREDFASLLPVEENSDLEEALEELYGS